MDLSEVDTPAGPREIRRYMKSLFHAINALAELSGPPIQERRLLLEFPARAEAIQKPGMIAAVYSLLGANRVNPDKVKGWLADWKSAFQLACDKPGVDGRIHAIRVNYYDKAVKAMLEGDTPLAALWPLLQTWTLSAEVLEGDHFNFWQGACMELGLLGDGFGERVQELDHFLDEIEIIFEEIARENGLDVAQSL